MQKRLRAVVITVSPYQVFLDRTYNFSKKRKKKVKSMTILSPLHMIVTALLLIVVVIALKLLKSVRDSSRN